MIRLGAVVVLITAVVVLLVAGGAVPCELALNVNPAEFGAMALGEGVDVIEAEPLCVSADLKPGVE